VTQYHTHSSRQVRDRLHASTSARHDHVGTLAMGNKEWIAAVCHACRLPQGEPENGNPTLAVNTTLPAHF